MSLSRRYHSVLRCLLELELNWVYFFEMRSWFWRAISHLRKGGKLQEYCFCNYFLKKIVFFFREHVGEVLVVDVSY
jgi:hypothetical protein